MSRIVISILNLYKSAVSWRGSCDLTHHYRLQAQRLEHAMIPPISVFRGNPDRSSAGGWAATPRRLISVAAAASVLSELGNVFQWRRRMEAEHGGLLLMEDVSVCLTRLQYQFKSLTGWSLPFMKVLLFSKQSLPAASNKATEDLIGRTQDACVTLYWLVWFSLRYYQADGTVDVQMFLFLTNLVKSWDCMLVVDLGRLQLVLNVLWNFKECESSKQSRWR